MDCLISLLENNIGPNFPNKYFFYDVFAATMSYCAVYIKVTHPPSVLGSLACKYDKPSHDALQLKFEQKITFSFIYPMRQIRTEPHSSHKFKCKK